MQALIIRAASSDDLPELTRLWHEKAVLAQQFDRRLLLAPDASVRWSAMVSDWLADSDCSIFVAERRSDLLGFAIGAIRPALPGFMPEVVGHITDLIVDAHAHQGGVGRLLLAELGVWFKARQVQHIIVHVARRQAVEQAFWRSQGATEWIDLMWMKL